MTRTALLATLVTAAVSLAQAKEAAPAHVHLVGHEDAALLARVQQVIDDWDPRKLGNPYLRTMPVAGGGTKTVVRRPDLLEFVADAEAAVALGKALFWEMRAGSDFQRRTVGKREAHVGTACASCHSKNGTDARDRNTSRVAFVAWDKYRLDPNHPAAADPANVKPAEGEFAQRPFVVNADPGRETKDVALIVGSQGVEPRLFRGLVAPTATGDWRSEDSGPRTLPGGDAPEWSMFLERPGVGGRPLRQITNRNSPTTHNAVFADRLFHDARAESTFNGFSIFGDHDKRQVLFKRPPSGPAVPVQVGVPKAALASQAVGPVVNEVEMSYLGRTFHHLADKLLDRPWLEHQSVAADDSVLSAPWLRAGGMGAGERITYRELVKKAFRREWWEDPTADADRVPLRLNEDGPSGTHPKVGSLMQANFSLYWGLSILLYESTLISDQTPFDAMLRGDGGPVEERWTSEYKAKLGPVFAAIGKLPPRKRENDPLPPRAKLELTTGTAVFQLGFRTFLNRGCVECHSGPLFSEVHDRGDALEIDPKTTIAHVIERALLPYAQGDAIALAVREYRREVGSEVRSHLARLGLSPARQRSHEEALWRMLPRAAGDVTALRGLVARLLGSGAGRDEWIDRIAADLMTFEKRASTRTGARRFFAEQERVDLAERIVDLLRIEKMLLPERLTPHRPRLPIAGPLAADAYAFYDAGFYAIGVSPPRLDRGIGNVSGGFDDILVAGVSELSGPLVREALRQGVGQARPSPSIAQSERQQAAGGARGSAYRLKAEWKRPTPPGQPQKSAAFDFARGPGSFRDLSWSRNVVPPESGIPDLAVGDRRADLHFLSRARRLAFNEEPTGHRKPFLHDNELAFWGAFKTPTLRNVELTAPYMHNGRLYDLEGVIEFYDRGGLVRPSLARNPDLHPEMVSLNMSPDEKKALRFFLACLTDPRVRGERGPFDHPSLLLPNGYGPTHGAVGDEVFVRVGEVGRNGHSSLPPIADFPN